MRLGWWKVMMLGVSLLGWFPAVAGAQQPLPSVNLGFTSFLDGGPPAGPGFYFQEYGQYYTAGTFRDQHGDKTPLLGSLSAWVSLNQLIYQSDQPILLGGKWGLDVIVPLVGIDVHPGQAPVLSNNSSGGLGDIVVGPFIQWDPIMGAKGPIFMHRIELQNLIPTGTYRDDRLLNPGSNFYSFNPYWAGTVFFMPQWTGTWRLHYLWNAENQKPYSPLKQMVPNLKDTQAGQAVHINFASEYEVVPNRIRLGVNGYYLKQFTNAEMNGNALADTREQVLGIGPGAVYHISQNDHVFFNAYFETQAENRPEGSRFILRWTHHF